MNRRTRFSLALPLCAAALLDAQLNTPKAGIVRYPDGTVHAVYGIPANYIVDPEVLASADAVSFSDRGGLLAKDGRILLLDASFKTVAEYQSGETAPLLNVDGDLKTAIAWLPVAHALLHWNGTSFVSTPVNGAVFDRVSSLALTSANTVKLLATNADKSVSEATISLDSGELASLDVVPGVRGPAFHQQSSFVFPDEHGLAIASASALLRTLPLSATDLTMERMSSDTFHLVSSSTHQSWVLHVGSSPSLFQLPEPARISRTLPIAGEGAQK